jgi:TolB-like protein
MLFHLRYVVVAAAYTFALVSGGYLTNECRAGDTITLAVLDFEDTSPESQFPKCNRALQSFLTTDLAQCRDIVVIERAMLDEVRKELDLAGKGFLDPTQAVAVGKQLQADAVLTGSIWIAQNRIRLDARLVHTETGTVLLGDNIEGDAMKFTSLEKQLADQLIDSLGVRLSALEKAALRKPHTENLRAANKFGMALAAEAAGDAVAARAYATEAAKEDPAFSEAVAVAKAVDDLLANLRDDRTQRQILAIHEFEDHVLHAPLSRGGFGPKEFTALVKEGKPKLALFRWLIRIRGAVDHEDQATAFDDSYPGKKHWPYRSLFAKPGPLMEERDGIVGSCYFEMGAAEPILFWCDVALSDDRYAPRTPLTEEQINPDWRSLPARGLDRSYFYPYMLDVLSQRMRAEVSLNADYKKGLATVRDIERLCGPWLNQQWLVGQLEQMRNEANDSRAFAQAKKRARDASVRWKLLEQNVLLYHHAFQALRFGKNEPYSPKTTIAAERKRLRVLLQKHNATALGLFATPERTEADAEWLIEQANGKNFIAWPVGSIAVDSTESMRWVVHVAGCPSSVPFAESTAQLPADDPRRPRGLDHADLCLEDFVAPCSKCRPCRWVNDEKLSHKLRNRIPLLIQAIDQPTADDEVRAWYDKELLSLLWAFCDTPTPGVNEALRILCRLECKSDRHDREHQALALQCLGKTIRVEDAESLVELYDESLPFDCRANIAAALGSLGGKNIQATLEAWISREPYDFVRHSLKASLSRSLYTQWLDRRNEILQDVRPKSVDDAILALCALVEEGSRPPIIGQIERPMIGRVHLDLGSLCEEADRPVEERDAHYRKAVSMANEDSYLLATALNSLAYSLALQSRDLDEAEAAVRKALRIASTLSTDGSPFDDTYMLDTKAFVLFRQGKFKEAKNVATQCTSRPSGQTLEIYDHLGDIMAALNNPAEAKDAWRKALSLSSESAQDQRMAKRIQIKLTP